MWCPKYSIRTLKIREFCISTVPQIHNFTFPIVRLKLENGMTLTPLTPKFAFLIKLDMWEFHVKLCNICGTMANKIKTSRSKPVLYDSVQEYRSSLFFSSPYSYLSSLNIFSNLEPTENHASPDVSRQRAGIKMF